MTRLNTPDVAACPPLADSLDACAANFLNLVESELIAPLNELQQLARGLAARPADAALALRLERLSGETAAKLDALKSLAETCGSGFHLDDLERLDLVDLLQAAAEAGRIDADIAGPKAVPTGGGEPPLAPVYGSPYWLLKSFAILFGVIAGSQAAPALAVEVARQGTSLVVNIAGQACEHGQARTACPHDEAALETVLAERIIALHGGEVRERRAPAAEAGGTLRQVCVSLPTGGGAPLHPQLPQCFRCRAVLQNRQLAADFQEVVSMLSTLERNTLASHPAPHEQR